MLLHTQLFQTILTSKKASAKGPRTDLEVGPRSGPYLLVTITRGKTIFQKVLLHTLLFRAILTSNSIILVFCRLLVIKNVLISYIYLSWLVVVRFRSLKKSNRWEFNFRDISISFKCQKRPTYARTDAAPGAHFQKLDIGVDKKILA